MNNLEIMENLLLLECIRSASESLKKAGVGFERDGEKLVVGSDDYDKARDAIQKGASSPLDLKFLSKK